MNNLNDKQLIKLVKQGNSDAFTEICNRYENIFYRICHRYTNILEKLGISCQDIFEEKNNIIYNCILSFDCRKKTKLSSWIGNWARYMCLKAIKSRQGLVNCDSQEISNKIDDLHVKNNYLGITFKKEDADYINKLLSEINDKRVSNVIYLRNFGNKEARKWKNISKKMKISVQTAISLNKRGLVLLKKKIKKEGFSVKYQLFLKQEYKILQKFLNILKN